MSSKDVESQELNDQMKLFCHELLKANFNGTQAAKAAGYADSGAHVQASRLLKNPKVQEYLNSVVAARMKRVDVQADEILAELQRIGYADIRRIFDDEGAVLPMRDWPEDIARAVSAIEVDETFEYHHNGFHCGECGRRASKELVGQVRKFKLWGKTHSLEMLAKNKKLLTDKLEVTDKTGIASRLEKARKRGGG